MTEHFTGRTFDGELVTVRRIRSDNGRYLADFTLTLADGKTITPIAVMGSTRKSTPSQELCEKLGLMPYSDNAQKRYPFQAIVKQWGSGDSYIIDAVLIGDDLVKCVKTEELKPGQYILYEGNWCEIRGMNKAQSTHGSLRDIHITDTSRSDPKFYDITISRYATAWSVVRDGMTEFEKAKAS